MLRGFQRISQSVVGARKSGARVGGRCSSQDSKRALEEQHQTLHQRGPGGMPRAVDGDDKPL